MSFNGTICDLRLAAFKLEKVDTLLNDIAEFFHELLEDRALTGDREYDIACFMKRMRDI